jgi:hypothetical protein
MISKNLPYKDINVLDTIKKKQPSEWIAFMKTLTKPVPKVPVPTPTNKKGTNRKVAVKDFFYKTDAGDILVVGAPLSIKLVPYSKKFDKRLALSVLPLSEAKFDEDKDIIIISDDEYGPMEEENSSSKSSKSNSNDKALSSEMVSDTSESDKSDVDQPEPTKSKKRKRKSKSRKASKSDKVVF